jgi:lipid II:glycine glycyltransferase (peptidoglycan interpeptide bridge formation enzyme)
LNSIDALPFVNTNINSWDLITPYGYVGPIFSSKANQKRTYYWKMFYESLLDFMGANQVISGFIRFHPLLCIEKNAPKDLQIQLYQDNIYLDLIQGEDALWQELSSPRRRSIKKARKVGVQVEVGKSEELFDESVTQYWSAMGRLKANRSFYFSESYFKEICKFDNLAHLTFAVFNNLKIATLLNIYNKNYNSYLELSIRIFNMINHLIYCIGK